MSIVVETFLVCDGHCGRNYGVDMRGSSSFTHRLSAKQEGWKQVKSKDYCPECVKQGKHKVSHDRR